MLNFLPPVLVGVIATLLLMLNALFWVPILLLVSIVKLIIPLKKVRLLIDPVLLRIAEAWTADDLVAAAAAGHLSD